jgi:pimeloyl-ACP methyl ester carboxylesterase
MIAQTLAIRHPSRVLSLISIMSSTGNPDLPGPSAEAAAALLSPVPEGREAAIKAAVQTGRVLAGGGFPFDETLARERAAEAFDRAFYPQGIARQMAAVVAHGSRVEALRRLTVPATIIHGTADPLVPVEAGKDTAGCIPGARLVLVEGMGHELPRGAWPQVVAAICDLTESVSQPTRGG